MAKGGTLVGFTTVVVGAATAITLAVFGTGEEGLGYALRLTARTSLALFLLAFVASSLNRLRPSAASKWLLRNRRYLGVSFAVSHFIHLGVIAARASLHSEAFFATRSLPSLIPGATAYAFITAMALTSTNGAVKRLGRKRWVALHKTGMYVIFIIFAGAYAGSIRAQPLDVIPLALLVAALALRGLARLRIRAKRRR